MHNLQLVLQRHTDGISCTSSLGNLKKNNILIDADFLARISDFGLHLILNSAAAQDMLEASAAQGYRAPELAQMRDASKESDIYSPGVILMEMLTHKDPAGNISSLHSKVSDIFSSELRNSAGKRGLLALGLKFEPGRQ